MSNTLTHFFHSVVPDVADSSLIRPSNWNHEHIFSGGASGQLLLRDSTQTDGARWLALGAVNTVLTGTGVDPVFSSTPTVASLTTTAAGGLLVGNAGEVRLLELTANGSQYVALAAPDAVTTSRRIVLPGAVGAAGTCWATDGGSPIETISYAACAGAGTGLTSLNGSILATQTFPNTDANLTMTTDAPTGTHTLGWTGTLSVPRGGFGSGTHTLNGVLYGNGTSAVLATAQGAANTVLVANAGAPSFSTTPTVSGLTTTGQAAVSLQPFGGGAGTGEIRFQHLAGTNYVGFKAPTAIAASRIWTLPAADGTPGQALTWNASGILSWTAPAAGAAGTNTQVQFNDGGVLGGDAAFVWDKANDRLAIGLTPTVPRPLTVTSATPPARFERSDAAIGLGSGTALQLVHATSGQMADGFDSQLTFLLRDADGIDNAIAQLRAYHVGAAGSGAVDAKGAFVISTAIAGGLSDRILFNEIGETLLGSVSALVGQSSGVLKAAISNSDNSNPLQTILSQIVNGTIAIGPATLGSDKVAVSGWAHRGTGGSSGIYGGNFAVNFTTNGPANGVEIGVLNNAGIDELGNGLWVNGNGSNTRANAILIDTQDASKWVAGIRFKEGNVGGGATGSISQFGIIFDKSHDADFLVIRPRVGAANVAIRITDPTFATNRFVILNDGSMVLGGAVPLVGTGTISTVGNISTSANMGANQYFSNGAPGFGTPTTGTVKVAGACSLTIAGGIIINVTGC